MKRTVMMGSLLAMVACLGACSPAPADSGQTGAAGDTSPKMSIGPSETSAAQAEEPTEEAPDAGPELAEGYQLVEGLGIAAPGAAAFYQMDVSAPVSVENEYAKATLINAVRQDDSLCLQIRLLDHSVTQIPEDEVRQILEKEEEDRKKLDEGARVEAADKNYFCMDQEREIYGRSAFMDSLSGPNRSGYYGMTLNGRLSGDGMGGDGYGFRSRGSSTSYDDFFDKGYIVSTVRLTMEDAAYLTEPPKGTYTLKLDGFEDPLQFSFDRVAEFDSADGLPGAVDLDGNLFYVEGVRDGGSLQLSCYTYPRDGAWMYPTEAGLSYTDGTGTEKKAPMGPRDPGKSGKLEGSPFEHVSGSSYQEFVFTVPEEDTIDSAQFVWNGVRLSTEEQSEVYTIPVPESEEDLDIQVEFADGTLSITKAERLDEPMVIAQDEKSGDVTAPGIYLTVAVKAKEEDKFMNHVMAMYADQQMEDSDSHRSYLGNAEMEMSEGADRFYENELLGYRAACQEGDSQIRLIFERPSYYWNKQFEIPVDIQAE